MSVHVVPGLRVSIKQYLGPRPPMPLPTMSGFRSGAIYEILGCHNPSETAECYFLLANDRNELWWISNRHLRFVGK